MLEVDCGGEGLDARRAGVVVDELQQSGADLVGRHDKVWFQVAPPSGCQLRPGRREGDPACLRCLERGREAIAILAGFDRAGFGCGAQQCLGGEGGVGLGLRDEHDRCGGGGSGQGAVGLDVPGGQRLPQSVGLG